MPGARLGTRDLIERLIGFDTTSRNSNLALIEFVRDYLAGWGVESELVFDETGSKANLFATVGPRDKGGVVLSGHTDVVPVDGQKWSSDPFAAVVRDGRLYGRGACDMKGFIAIALAAVPAMLEAGLSTPIHFALSYDEEVGCLGARRLLEMLEKRPLKPLRCIVGEPTEMQVVNGHKGKLTVGCEVSGVAGHSAHTDKAVNAIEYAAEIIGFLSAEARKRREEGPFDKRYDPAYSTLQTGVIAGGVAINVVPASCRFEFEFRNLPDDDPHAVMKGLRRFVEGELVPRMKAVSEEAGVRFAVQSEYPGLAMAEEDEVVRMAKRLSRQNRTVAVSYGTEAGLYKKSGIPVVICGPGSIQQAHKADEFVSLEQVSQCEDFITRLIGELAQ